MYFDLEISMFVGELLLYFGFGCCCDDVLGEWWLFVLQFFDFLQLCGQMCVVDCCGYIFEYVCGEEWVFGCGDVVVDGCVDGLCCCYCFWLWLYYGGWCVQMFEYVVECCFGYLVSIEFVGVVECDDFDVGCGVLVYVCGEVGKVF